MSTFQVGDLVVAIDQPKRTGRVSKVKRSCIRVTLDTPEHWGNVTSMWVESAPRLWRLRKSIL